jgi:hypothetical protein
MIKKIIKIIFFVILIVWYYYLQKYLWDIKIKNDLLNSLITFFSILFWFYITSLSIFVSSKYVSNLYQIEDKENSSQTLLHKLLFNYKVWLFLILFTIIYLLFITIILNQIKEQNINYLVLWDEKILYIFIWLIILNIWYSYNMLWTTFKIILQESKNK